MAVKESDVPYSPKHKEDAPFEHLKKEWIKPTGFLCQGADSSVKTWVASLLGCAPLVNTVSSGAKHPWCGRVNGRLRGSCGVLANHGLFFVVRHKSSRDFYEGKNPDGGKDCSGLQWRRWAYYKLKASNRVTSCEPGRPQVLCIFTLPDLPFSPSLDRIHTTLRQITVVRLVLCNTRTFKCLR